MMLSDELASIAKRLDKIIASSKVLSIQELTARLEIAAQEVAKAWSGSSLGYHANVYYDGLQPAPAGAHFSSEFGLMDIFHSRRTYGDWKEFDSDEVRAAVYHRAGNPDVGALRQFDNEATREFNDCKMNVLSILESEMTRHDDAFLSGLKDKVGKLSVISKVETAKHLCPSGPVMSRDSTAINQGFKLPPHLDVLSEVASVKNTLEVAESLAQTTRQAELHISRQQVHRKKVERFGTKVFIGHGHSPVWRELKDFIADRLGLPVDEFNRVPVAGLTNVDRLSQMLDTASIAFLILTGEDEQPDGKLQGRMNVVHEAGLFQGRLGFRRAIVVLERGCEEFSNISGLGQLRFSEGNIKEVFEEIREVLEREGLLQVDS